jgi:hypothetical protein
MLQSSMHIIATGRSKTETSQEDAGGGKKKVVKLGMKTEQRDGFEYEFTVVLDIVHSGHYAIASKDRTNLYGDEPFKITEQTGYDLATWLESGADVQPTPERDSTLADWCSAIQAAATGGELKTTAAKALQWAGNDTDAANRINAAIEAKKATAKAKETV